MELNNNEVAILDILRNDPYITQKQLADRMNLSRPAVANMISGLQQKGYILGKPYVLQEHKYITCVGGANIDYTFRLENQMTLGTSNPVVSSVSYGGVIRNVAENLARLESKVSLMTIVGDDTFGDELIQSSKKIMEVFASEKAKGKTTGGYYSVIDEEGNMTVGFADMSLTSLMNRSWILEHKNHLNMSSWIIADLNISIDAIEALIEFSNRTNIPIAIIGVSNPKMKNLPKNIKGVNLIICNMDETQTYFKTLEDNCELLCNMWLDAGVKKAIVTAGIKGSYFGESNTVNHQKAYIIPKKAIVDVTGAGDAFSSATIYGITEGKSLAESVNMGAISSSLTIQVPFAVNPNLSNNLFKRSL